MGLINEKTNVTFRIADQQIFKKYSATGYEGRLIKIEQEKVNIGFGKIDLIKLYIKDEDKETAVIEFDIKSAFSILFFEKIRKINLKESFLISISEYGAAKCLYCDLNQFGKDIEIIESDKNICIGDWSEIIEIIKNLSEKFN